MKREVKVYDDDLSATRTIDYLLIGGGLASATAAETLRLEGAEGSIVIVSAEDWLPYHRPPLSGQLMKSDAPQGPLPVLTEEDYRARDIELLRGVRALAVDPHEHRVRTDRAGTLAYRKLLIATGASPRRPQVPGAGLSGIHYLRTVEDARAIHEAAQRGRRCVVIGASFIGMEVSSALRQRGLDVHLVAGPAGLFGPLQGHRDRRVLCSALRRPGNRRGAKHGRALRRQAGRRGGRPERRTAPGLRLRRRRHRGASGRRLPVR